MWAESLRFKYAQNIVQLNGETDFIIKEKYINFAKKKFNSRLKKNLFIAHV